MIETGMTAMIQLWEQFNSDVHGKSNIEEKQKPKISDISDLLSRQQRCLPKDHFLFPSDPKELLDKNIHS